LRPVRPSSQLRSSPHRWRRRIAYTRIAPSTAPFYLCPSELDKLFAKEIKSAPPITYNKKFFVFTAGVFLHPVESATFKKLRY
jgi:hypothetical protein